MSLETRKEVRLETETSGSFAWVPSGFSSLQAAQIDASLFQSWVSASAVSLLPCVSQVPGSQILENGKNEGI